MTAAVLNTVAGLLTLLLLATGVHLHPVVVAFWVLSSVMFSWLTAGYQRRQADR